MLTPAVPILVCLIVAAPSFAQFGIFEQDADWGTNGDFKVPGQVTVTGTGTSATYEIEGNGDDIWGSSDEGYYIYKELSGSWTLSSKVEWFYSANEWAKMGVMIREQGSAADSANFIALLRGNETGDQSYAQWRPITGSSSSNSEILTPEGGSVNHHDGNLHLRVTRIAPIDLFFCEWSPDGNTWYFGHSLTIEMGDTVAYGLALTNHVDDEDVAIGQFSNVELNPAPPVVVRSTPGPAYTPGKPFEITLDIINDSDSAVSLAISENVPEGWSASDISDGGSVSDGVISWTVSAEAGTTTVSYTIAPGDGVSGNIALSGTGGDLAILGTGSMSEGLPEHLKVIFEEDFESTPEDQLPAGWKEVNFTDEGGTERLKTWTVLSYDTIAEIGGNRVNVPVVDGNSVYADSDGYGSPYYEAHLMTPSIDLSGVSEVYLTFDSNYLQNQDNIGVLEYSIDGGDVSADGDITGTWLPIVYMMDVDDIAIDEEGNIDALTTLSGEADGTGFTYGDYAYALYSGMTEEDLAPYISIRVDDDDVESKRHEIYRLPQADNQSNVVIRWVNMGTFSWFWGIDNLKIMGDDGTYVSNWSLY